MNGPFVSTCSAMLDWGRQCPPERKTWIDDYKYSYICCDLIFEEGNFQRTSSPHSFKHSQVQFSLKKKINVKKTKQSMKKRQKETSQEKKEFQKKKSSFIFWYIKLMKNATNSLWMTTIKIRVDVQEIKQTISFHHVK